MKAFVVYPTYRIIDGKAYVYLFGKLENGESFLSINYTRPYFFIKKNDLKKAQTVDKFDYEETKSKNFNNEEVTKIIVDLPKEVSQIRKNLEEQNIVCYEADLNFSYRFMLDNNIKAITDISGEYKKGDFVGRIYEEPKFKECKEYQVELKALSFDIETNFKADKLFCLSYAINDKNNTHETLIVSKDKVKGATIYPDEKSLLEAFKDIIQKQDPDIITGWNVIDFDLMVLRDKFRQYKIPFILGRADWQSSLRIESDFFRDSKADFAGRQVLDGIALLKNNFIKLPDYKLDTAAKEIIGDKKSIQFGNKVKEIEEMFENNKEKLVKYNLKDAELVLNILKEKNLINLTVVRSMLTGMPLDRVSASIASLDSLYLRETMKKNIVCNSSSYNDSEERIKGGFVRESTPGIFNWVIVCDFKSLYPSVIRTFNIDPISLDKKGEIKAPNGATFRNEDSILPLLIQDLWLQRDKAKKNKDDIASFAIKITMNSFFGVLANPNCRFYSLEMANAITHFGQKIVKETAENVEKLGYKVIYGDTDSIFIDSQAKDYNGAKKDGEKIQKFVNEFYKKQVKDEYNRKSFLELEFEKVYRKFILPMVRDSGLGAKKRYAGLKTDGKTEELQFVGLEVVRRDWTKLAKDFQTEILQRIFDEKDITKYVKKVIDDLRAGKLDDKLIYRKALRKPLEAYTKTTPPHVKAARLLPKLDGTIIDYILTENGPEPIQILKSKIDYEHYIKKQLKPIADSVLVFFDQKFEDILRGNTQQSLFDY